jgi:hypothetical protein
MRTWKLAVSCALTYFNQRRVISSENECLYCIDLNNKLKYALNEVSSLNLIIQLLWNKLACDCGRVSLDTNSSIDKQEDHEVSVHRNWIEVESKRCSNLYSFKKRNSFPVNQPILPSNHYTQLTYKPTRSKSKCKRCDRIQ